MSNQLVHCPACHKMLRSDRALPAGTTLRCPECKAGFAAPEPEPEPAAPALFGPAFVIAVAVALILGGSVITAALLLSGPRPEPKADDDAARRLADEQRKLDESRKELAEARRKLDLAGWLTKGEAALAAGKLDEADKAFTAAAALAPTDPAVVKGLVSVRSALDATKKGDEDGKKRDAERDRLLAEGRKAFADKQYAKAVPLLESARALAPADAAVLAALNDARTALEGSEAQKKTLADYNARLAAGKTALEAGQYTDAVREFASALALMPDSAEAKDGQKQAAAKLAAAGDAEKLKAEFEAMLGRARKAMADTRFTEAVAAVEGALRLIADDREGQRLLKSASDALAKVKSSNAKLVAQANASLAAGQLEHAVATATQAVKAWAEDEGAKKALRKAEHQLEAVRANQEAYLRAVQSAALAMSTRQYADAVAAYAEALRLSPGNDEIARQLRNARILQEAYLRNRTEYERLIRVGSLALNRNGFADALKAFTAASKLLPDDLSAQEGMSRARYGQAMVDGQQALKLKRKAEAVMAFEAALAEKPGDLAARRGLLEAQRLK